MLIAIKLDEQDAIDKMYGYLDPLDTDETIKSLRYNNYVLTKEKS